MKMKIYGRIAVAVTGASIALLLSAGPALAGEVNGNGKELPLMGKSICKYSGLNDNPNDPMEPTRTQSYGTFLVLLGPGVLPSPGVACNPTSGFQE